VVVPYSDLEAMVDVAIMVEDKHKAARESRKRRMMSQGGPSSQRSRSLPPARPAPPLRGLHLKPLGPITPTVSSTATVLVAETTQVVTATLQTPTLMAKGVAAILVAILDTSPRSVP
jgi:hypothetical protein